MTDRESDWLFSMMTSLAVTYGLLDARRTRFENDWLIQSCRTYETLENNTTVKDNELIIAYCNFIIKDVPNYICVINI
jgi:hypothetical protein